jgi:uncharacterized alpha-E superfamily protein
MLARVAESLYWIGRNIERAEHFSRYIKVQYFSIMDESMVHNKDFTLRSILFMSGAEDSQTSIMTENQVLQKVIFDPNNPNSILSIIRSARENARSIRNSISTELWESINKLYLHLQQVDAPRFNTFRVYQFSVDMKSDLCVVKSNIRNTLLHNDVWHFICLGIYIERCLQILRIMRSKISDWTILSNNGENKALMIFQWTILLKSLESFDLHNHLHTSMKTKKSVFSMILKNRLFPRSIPFCVERIVEHLSLISVKKQPFKEFCDRFEDKTAELLEFEEFEDEEEVINHLDMAYDLFADTHFEIQRLYFQ